MPYWTTRSKRTLTFRPWRARIVVAAGLALSVLPAAFAQRSSGSGAHGRTGGGLGQSSNPGSGILLPGSDPAPETDGRLENSRARAREQDRQKRMVDDANRLVALTARYRASVSEHGSATAEDTRMLLEMEKLARAVKDRMRGM